MKRWLVLALLVFVGSAGWRIGEALSPDALSMAIGVLFGVKVCTRCLAAGKIQRAPRGTQVA